MFSFYELVFLCGVTAHDFLCVTLKIFRISHNVSISNEKQKYEQSAVAQVKHAQTCSCRLYVANMRRAGVCAKTPLLAC